MRIWGALLAIAIVGLLALVATEDGRSRLSYAALVARVLWEARFDEAEVPAFDLPELLATEAGEPIGDRRAWRARRAQLLATFRDDIYGRAPTNVGAPPVEILDHESGALKGLAERRQLRVWPGGREQPSAELLLWLPAARTGPVPVFVGLNFWGNHTTHPDPAILLESGWMRHAPDRGIEDHRATEASRGQSQSRWPVRALLSRGYGLATAFAGDFAADVDTRGVGPEFGGEGALTTWSWGLRRIADALVAWPDEVGPLLVVGHSRLGKAALWAGAQDERFAAVFSNDSGCLGAALSRCRFGETLALMTDNFPHWFPPRFAERYAGREDGLPVDQHQLLALIAPRPLYVASASDDLWADPRGEYLAAREASRAYELLGMEGLRDDEPPPVDQPVHRRVGYHLRTGEHDLTVWDWERFLDFADLHLPADGR
jgi:hypothetical protein